MNGYISQKDIQEIRSRIKIEDIVSEYVTLRTCGMGTLKGLCPFHDEKTPSFHVRTHLGLWHCFGCSKGGDVISFVQEINQMTFTQSVEYLASKIGYTITYENTKKYKDNNDANIRKRIVEINIIANEIYKKNLLTKQALGARKFLFNKGFSQQDCSEFDLGYALDRWDQITSILMRKGYTIEELLASGIASKSSNSRIYDRFRNRVIWPIKDIVGQVIGFGARKLDEKNENSPKYLNTPETVVYKKNQVLYGLNLAKKEIVSKKQVIVVEGYTDVMASHLAGIKNVVATCGTAFGSEHTKILKRLLGDGIDTTTSIAMGSGKTYGGEVIFTFDSDNAGMKAALRAFKENQNFVAQTFIALDSKGMDPCDIRLYRGDEALREIINNRVPLVEFVIKSAIKDLDLTIPEGRTQAQKIVLPIIMQIKDNMLRSEYIRAVSGWIGTDITALVQKNNSDAHKASKNRINNSNAQDRYSKEDIDEINEKKLLQLLLQIPQYVNPENINKITVDCFKNPIYKEIFMIINNIGGFSLYEKIVKEEKEKSVDYINISSQKWADTIIENASENVKNNVYELLIDNIPQDKKECLEKYCSDNIKFIYGRYLKEQTNILHAKLNRIKNSSDDEFTKVFKKLINVENEIKKLGF